MDAARDMDVLRAALGEPKLNYLGASYGTFLGATYAGLFPAQVGRFVLDGPLPPDVTAQDLMTGQAKGFEIATQAYVDDCVKHADCPVGQSRDQGMAWIRDFLRGLEPAPAGHERPDGHQPHRELGAVGISRRCTTSRSGPS